MAGASGSDTAALQGVLSTLALFFFVGLAFYVYFGITVMMIAKKTRTPNAGLAWLPIGNLFLMCAIGRRPAWWVLLLLIPVVNILIAAMIWMSMAEARGKPAWAGVLALVPGLGLIIPAYLAAGPATDPDGAQSVPAGPRRCSACGAVAAEDVERFCGECGAPLPAAAPAVKRKSAGQLALVAAALLVGIIVIGGGLVQAALRRALAYTPPQRRAPALPARAQGTLKEFPIDPGTDNPFRPSSVVTQQFGSGSARASRSGSSPTSTQVPQSWLPAGVTTSSIPSRTRAMTSAVYRSRNQPESRGSVAPSASGSGASQQQSPGKDSIFVHVLDPAGDPQQLGRELTSSLVQASGVSATGVSVQSPTGASYRGARVTSSKDVTYVLVGQGSGRVIVIYAPDPALAEAATRLARNVGNGQGLIEDPEVKNSLWVLPAEPPDDLTLLETNSYTPEDLGFSEQGIQSASQGDAALRQSMEQVRQILPGRLTTARFVDRSDRDWKVLLGEFPSPTRAWSTWMTLRWTIGLGGFRAVKVGDGDGLYQDTKENSLLLFQKGPYLGIIAGPPGVDAGRLARLGRSFQL